MPTATHTAPAPDYISAEWLYDSLMAQIEPDLMLGTIDTLDERYAGEAPERKKMRAEKYKAAFSLYDECLAELDWILADDARIFKDDMAAFAQSLEQYDKQADEKAAEDMIDSSTSRT